MFWTYFAIGVLVAGSIIICVLILWPHQDKTLRRPVEQVLAKKKTTSYEEYEYVDGEPVPKDGPSAGLLAMMDGAGMNTTHERYDDFEKSRRRGVHRPLQPGERPVSRRKPDDDDVAVLGALAAASLISGPAEGSSQSHPGHSSPSDGGGGHETGGAFGGGGFETGGGDSDGGGGND